jgi:hypothetical protein
MQAPLPVRASEPTSRHVGRGHREVWVWWSPMPKKSTLTWSARTPSTTFLIVWA